MDANSDFLVHPGHAHLVGAAGNGMRALAEVLATAGWRLTGSDATSPSPPTASVGTRPAAVRRRLGAVIGHASPHHPDNVPAAADLLIHSAAVGSDNVELRRAGQWGIPVLSYPEALGRLSRARPTLAVAGTHGKSSTVAMTAAVLRSLGVDPTVFGGATPIGHRSGGQLGRGPTLLVEACEYRRHFLHLQPTTAVLLPIEPDHFDCFPDNAELEAAFREFVALLPEDGVLLAAADCHRAMRVARSARCSVLTFGLDRPADFTAQAVSHDRGRYRFAFCRNDEPIVEITLTVPGRHNVLNALAALAIGSTHSFSGRACPPCPLSLRERARVRADQHRLDASGTRALQRGLLQFRGLHRRLEEHAHHGDVCWIDDYAHHPTELRAALTTVRQMFPGRPITCVFQPHQASRTAALFDGFVGVLGSADRVAVVEVFRAREGGATAGEPTATDLARAVSACGIPVAPCHGHAEIAAWLARSLQPGDVLLTAGAGDVDRIGLAWCGLPNREIIRTLTANGACREAAHHRTGPPTVAKAIGRFTCPLSPSPRSGIAGERVG